MGTDVQRAAKYLEALGAPISLSVALCQNYSALLRGEHGAPLSQSELLSLASQRGRVLLSGRGGSGKSTIMRRLVVDAGTDKTAIFVDLSRWDHDASEGWKLRREGAREAIDFLLRRFSSGEKDVADLDFLPAQREKLLIIDGLNETPGSVADDILNACDQAASFIVNCSVIVSDRLVRRRTNGEERWYFAMPLRVDIDEARIYNAARLGIALDGCTAYVNWFPCVDCARAIVQAGVIRLVCLQPNNADERWGSEFEFAQDMLRESGTEITLYDYPELAARR